ncbi:Mitochondrial dynamin-like protein [Trichinella pseudospiralis]|uniref:Dynamin-like GTPase OPA1, mitochondrial n=1 Tax=Trichinella pseudospiralis TaxID=6337 RepID=A0A0V1G6Y7_TRIPS|nr:Mitochondrial dynamin-like protein [Trichinella pseudospiralis]
MRRIYCLFMRNVCLVSALRKSSPCFNVSSSRRGYVIFFFKSILMFCLFITLVMSLLKVNVPLSVAPYGIRNFSLITRLVKGILHIRYVVIGTIVGGGLTLSQNVQSWVDKFPDLSWLNMDSNVVAQLKDSFRTAADIVTTQKMLLYKKMEDTGWLPKQVKSDLLEWFEDKKTALTDTSLLSMITEPAVFVYAEEAQLDEAEKAHERRRNDILQTEMKFQEKIEQLEKENAELRRVLQSQSGKDVKLRKGNESLIDMYSSVLDLLIDYDSSYSTQDHLPRVVVVGDQSSGKTSVLEMIAQARIFPRGSGEMMTRAPVKVTLSDGPYHIAQFRDSQREFDLTSEKELAELRREIELRMLNSVKGGKTVSNEVIGLSVKGPGLPRMVLVDLPGVISTVTTGMAADTKEDILKICKTYLENPNAIILCIQDGSVDAERSNVTELVSSVDPGGKRTILVLTKVDLAEENLANPDMIKKILQGELFPMKALGYFAVVTGKGNSGDSIDVIKNYEESFFAKSQLFQGSILPPSQLTTKNMSLAVSRCFWKMVKESIGQQADSFKAVRFNLETEWKNRFPKLRDIDRDELYTRAKTEILDELVQLNATSTAEWETALREKLWETMSSYVFENILISAFVGEKPHTFNTTVDIKLKHWADTQLPRKCVEAGWAVLREQFTRLNVNKKQPEDGWSSCYKPLKEAVIEKALNSHTWNKRALESLRIIQQNALEDRTVPSKACWKDAISFMEDKIKQRLKELEKHSLHDSKTARWLRWSSPSEDELKMQAIADQLKPLLYNISSRNPFIDSDEMIMIRRNVRNNGFEVEEDEVRETWHQLYRVWFLRKSLLTANECQSMFLHHQKGFDEMGDCSSVVLFWRVQRMLHITANALRQQIVSTEVRNLEKEIKEILNEWSHDFQMKRQYLQGAQVELAEKLKQVRVIQEKIEDFIAMLNNESKRSTHVS